jgi:hypothetical protein
MSASPKPAAVRFFNMLPELHFQTSMSGSMIALLRAVTTLGQNPRWRARHYLSTVLTRHDNRHSYPPIAYEYITHRATMQIVGGVL